MSDKVRPPPEATIHGDSAPMVYIDNWYDGPISGHIFHAGQYYYFEFEDSYVPRLGPEYEGLRTAWISYRLWPLTGEPLVYALAARKIWEDCVGYDNSHLPQLGQHQGCHLPRHPHPEWANFVDSNPEFKRILQRSEPSDEEKAEAWNTQLIVWEGEPHPYHREKAIT